jgi:hypothetical protein
MIKELLSIGNELDQRGLHREASLVDLCLKKIAMPREMSEELRESVSGADAANIIEPGEVFSRSNYLGISGKIGPMPEFGSSIPRVTISSGPIHRIPSAVQISGYKPKGLWYGCGNEWLEWLTYEMPQWIGRYIYAIELNEDNILKITSDEQFSAFEKAYGIPGYGGVGKIDWKKVSEEHGGIEICPYRHSRRMSSDWYYPWDVASGCAWDSSSIKSIKLVSRTSEEQGGDSPSEDDPESWDWHGL